MPSLIATIGANIAPFTRGLDEAKGKARGAGQDIGGALGGEIGGKLKGLISLAAIEEIARKTIEYGSKVQDLSNRLGISTDAVQQWDYALKLNGSSIDAAAGFFEKLAISREKALRGSESEIQHFRKLGISLEDLKTKRLENLGGSIAQAFEMGDPQELISSLRSVGGKGAGELVAAFRDGLAGLLDEAPLISEENIAKLARMDDMFTKMGVTIKVWAASAIEFIVGLGGALVGLVDGPITVAFGMLNGLMDGISQIDLKHPIESAKRLSQAVFEDTQFAVLRLQQRKDERAKEAADEEAARKAKRGKSVNLGSEDEKAEEKAEKAAVAEAKRVLSLQEQIAEIRRKSALDGMKEGEKEIELARQIAALKSEAEEMRVRGFAESEVLEVEKDAAQRESDLDRLTTKAGRSRDKAFDRVHPIELTEGQKLGAYVNPALLAANTQMQEAQKTNQNLSKILAELKEHKHLLGNTKF